jgi:hypothetical protein
VFLQHITKQSVGLVLMALWPSFYGTQIATLFDSWKFFGVGRVQWRVLLIPLMKWLHNFSIWVWAWREEEYYHIDIRNLKWKKLLNNFRVNWNSSFWIIFRRCRILQWICRGECVTWSNNSNKSGHNWGIEQHSHVSRSWSIWRCGWRWNWGKWVWSLYLRAKQNKKMQISFRFVHQIPTENSNHLCTFHIQR